MKTKRKRQIVPALILITVFSILFLSSGIVNASDNWESIPGYSNSLLVADDPMWDDCMRSGDCKLKHLVFIFIRASDIILGITGSLALLAFVVGGAMFLVSSGNSETVNRGKQVLIGAVIGLAIVFTSYIVINFVSVNMLGDSPGWNQTPTE